jgi:hypothetical protein
VKPYVLVDRASALPHFKDLRKNLTAPSSSRSSSSGNSQAPHPLESRVDALEALVRTLVANQDRLQNELDRRSSSRSTRGSHSVATGPPPSPQLSTGSPMLSINPIEDAELRKKDSIFLPRSSYHSASPSATGYEHLLPAGQPSPDPTGFRFPAFENRDVHPASLPSFHQLETSQEADGQHNEFFNSVFADQDSYLPVGGTIEALNDLDLPLRHPKVNSGLEATQGPGVSGSCVASAEANPSAEAGPSAEVNPSAEVGPSAEAGPSAKVNPSVEVVPSVEANPSEEANPSAEAGPSAEVNPSKEAHPATEAGSTEEVQPSADVSSSVGPVDAIVPSPSAARQFTGPAGENISNGAADTSSSISAHPPVAEDPPHPVIRIISPAGSSTDGSDMEVDKDESDPLPVRILPLSLDRDSDGKALDGLGNDED